MSRIQFENDRIKPIQAPTSVSRTVSKFPQVHNEKSDLLPPINQNFQIVIDPVDGMILLVPTPYPL